MMCIKEKSDKKKTTKKMSSPTDSTVDNDVGRDSHISPDFVHLQEEAVLSGYLYKKTRDGRWQRRWFETNGTYLTYYKVYPSSLSIFLSFFLHFFFFFTLFVC